MTIISVIDSHTGGEPTRIIVAGGPDLGGGSIAERAHLFQTKYDHIRTAVVGEPRGSDVVVGGLLCAPENSAHAAGVIFFDNAGLLGMCGHGTLGFAITLFYLGELQSGKHRIETPVGAVDVELINENSARITNVPSYRLAKDVTVNVDGFGCVTGDIAWGGNWFFLTHETPCLLSVEHLEQLTNYTKALRNALYATGLTGDGGAKINHIEIHGPPTLKELSAKNFVLCPGGAYDRSPCGTGTSARLACLAADGELQPGELWRQESIIGSVFESSFQWQGETIIPQIKGSAYVCGEAKLILDPGDPYRYGIHT